MVINMDYYGLGLWAFPVAIENNKRLTESEKEQLYMRCKDNQHDREADRVLNGDIIEDNVDSFMNLAFLSTINKSV